MIIHEDKTQQVKEADNNVVLEPKSETEACPPRVHVLTPVVKDSEEIPNIEQGATSGENTAHPETCQPQQTNTELTVCGEDKSDITSKTVTSNLSKGEGLESMEQSMLLDGSDVIAPRSDVTDSLQGKGGEAAASNVADPTGSPSRANPGPDTTSIKGIT